MKIALKLALIVSVVLLAFTGQGTLTVTSPAFSANGKIPAKYSCEGQGVTPPLRVDRAV